MRPRISFVTIAVDDIARSRRFYVDGLGFPAGPGSHDRAVFLQLEGTTWLSVVDRELLGEWAATPTEGTGFPGFVLSHNVATPKEVDEVLDLAIASGGTLHVSATDQPVGRIGYFRDPDGYLWEVAHTPAWTDYVLND